MFSRVVSLLSEVDLKVTLTRPRHFVFAALVEFQATCLTTDALEQQVAAHITESQREVRLPTLKPTCQKYSVRGISLNHEKHHYRKLISTMQ